MKNFINLKLHILNYAFIQLSSKALTLLSTYIIAFYASNEVFGYISLMQATLVAAITFFGFNLSSGVVRYYFERNTIEIFRRIIPILLFLFIASITVSLISYLYFIDNKYYIWFSFLPIIGFFNGVALISSMLARANNKIKLYAISELMRPIFLISLALIFIFYKFNIIKLFSITLLFSSVITLLLCYFFRLDLLNRETILVEGDSSFKTKHVIIYTAPLFFVQIMSLINNVSDKFIMTFFLSISEIGLYGKAYLIGSSLGLLFDSLMLLWTPYVIKNKIKIISYFYKKIITVSVLISVIGLVIFSVALLFVLLNNTLKSNIVILSILIISAFISRIGYQILTPIINAFDRTRWVAYISFISMVLGLVLNLFLIPLSGAVGAAIATFLSFFIYSLMSVFLIQKLKVKFSKG